MNCGHHMLYLRLRTWFQYSGVTLSNHTRLNFCMIYLWELLNLRKLVIRGIGGVIWLRVLSSSYWILAFWSLHVDLNSFICRFFFYFSIWISFHPFSGYTYMYTKNSLYENHPNNLFRIANEAKNPISISSPSILWANLTNSIC